jgi:hypothetical protein
VFQIKNFDEEGLDLRRVHVQVDVDEFLVELVQLRDFLYEFEECGFRFAPGVDALQVPAQEVVVGVLFELDHVLVDHPGPVRREQRNGTQYQDDVLVGAPLGVEGLDEALVLLVDVALGQLQDVHVQIERLLAVRDLQRTPSTP